MTNKPDNKSGMPFSDFLDYLARKIFILEYVDDKKYKNLQQENDQLKKELEDYKVAVCELQSKEHTLVLERNKLRAELDKYKWIPVSERLPDEDGYYLTYRILPSGKTGINICKFIYKHWSISCFVERITEQITHWMPLPDPPQTEKEEG